MIVDEKVPTDDALVSSVEYDLENSQLELATLPSSPANAVRYSVKLPLAS